MAKMIATFSHQISNPGSILALLILDRARFKREGFLNFAPGSQWLRKEQSYPNLERALMSIRYARGVYSMPIVNFEA
jgi:hypothetical protein